MRIGKLRMLLEQYGETTLRDLIIELYRVIPKNTLEEKDIDFMLSHYTRYKEDKSAQERVSIDKVITQADRFVESAYDSLYVKPNQVMSERDQKNWYIHAKKILRDLSFYAEDQKDARAMYEEIFLLLSSAAGEEPLFLTSDPFRLLKTTQRSMFEQLIHYYKIDAQTTDDWFDRSLYTALHIPQDIDQNRYDLLTTLFAFPLSAEELRLLHNKTSQLAVRALAKSQRSDQHLEEYQALKRFELKVLVKSGDLSNAERKLFSEYIPFFSHRTEPFQFYIKMLEEDGHTDETKRVRRLAKEKRIPL